MWVIQTIRRRRVPVNFDSKFNVDPNLSGTNTHSSSAGE